MEVECKPKFRSQLLHSGILHQPSQMFTFTRHTDGVKVFAWIGMAFMPVSILFAMLSAFVWEEETIANLPSLSLLLVVCISVASLMLNRHLNAYQVRASRRESAGFKPASVPKYIHCMPTNNRTAPVATAREHRHIFFGHLWDLNT